MSTKSNAKLAGLARARRSDPATSLDGARALEASGKGDRQRDLVLRGLKEHPDSTPYELADALGIDGVIPGKRLPELQKRKLAEPGKPRECRIRGSKARPWRAVTKVPRTNSPDLPGMPRPEYTS